MRHIFFIDPLEKLNIRKDSTLLMALTFAREGDEVYLLFEKDFSVVTHEQLRFSVYNFSGDFFKDSFHIEKFALKDKVILNMVAGDIFHMRIDPPVDARYMRYLWMQQILQGKGVRVINSPQGILQNNEKIFAYIHENYSIPTYIGASSDRFLQFVDRLKQQNIIDLILKPLDLYSGIGVEKISLSSSELLNTFKRKVNEFDGAIIAQPFMPEVLQGEFRSIYFAGKEIGTIRKTPKSGDYICNIAQGASYATEKLPQNLKKICDELSTELLQQDLQLIAFDLLGDYVTEVNITCPGLLLETSEAYGQNLAIAIRNNL